MLGVLTSFMALGRDRRNNLWRNHHSYVLILEIMFCSLCLLSCLIPHLSPSTLLGVFCSDACQLWISLYYLGYWTCFGVLTSFTGLGRDRSNNLWCHHHSYALILEMFCSLSLIVLDSTFILGCFCGILFTCLSISGFSYFS